MNNKTPSPAEIAARIEKLLGKAESHCVDFRETWRKLDEACAMFAEATGQTPFQTADTAERLASVAHSGAALLHETVEFHKHLSGQDPRPQTRDGGGK